MRSPIPACTCVSGPTAGATAFCMQSMCSTNDTMAPLCPELLPGPDSIHCLSTFFNDEAQTGQLNSTSVPHLHCAGLCEPHCSISLVYNWPAVGGPNAGDHPAIMNVRIAPVSDGSPGAGITICIHSNHQCVWVQLSCQGSFIYFSP